MPRKEMDRKKPVTKVQEGIKYDLALLNAKTSFGATLEEAARQAGGFLGTKISYEGLADIIGLEWPSEEIPDGRKICGWINNGNKQHSQQKYGTKPGNIEEAKAVARALRLPEEYFTRFYKTTV